MIINIMVIYYQYIFPFVKIIINMFISLECGRRTVGKKVKLLLHDVVVHDHELIIWSEIPNTVLASAFFTALFTLINSILNYCI